MMERTMSKEIPVMTDDAKTAARKAFEQLWANGFDGREIAFAMVAAVAEIVRGECHLPRQACMTTTFDEELQALFTLLKDRTGHDFSSYKRNTVLRRIERRMAVNEAGGLRKYLAILEENPQEAQTLCEDFLIGVTRFFRDPEAFELFRSEIIPSLFANRDPQDPIRIWHACCASGEEVYSVAMLILEYLEKENLQTKVQIFATDIGGGPLPGNGDCLEPGKRRH